jgi:hypothetical protein
MALSDGSTLIEIAARFSLEKEMPQLRQGFAAVWDRV